jgi:hypothetical protein
VHTDVSLPARHGPESVPITLDVNGDSSVLDIEPRVSLL